MHGVGSDPMHIFTTMSPLQIVVTFEELWKHVSRKKADEVSLARAAYHAESIEHLVESLTSFDKKAAKSVSPQDFMKFMRDYGKGS
jgi:hypothetical protein